MRKTPVHERFWDKVEKSEGCWLWTASTGGRSGYGRILDGGRLVMAHRLSYEWRYGEIPEGMQVLHKCDVPGCVNPDHLFLGNPKTNALDRERKGRSQSPQGVDHPNAKLTEEQVFGIRAALASGTRVCDLARKYGVGPPAIEKIRDRVRWKHLERKELKT